MELLGARWRKSSHSEQGGCVEIAYIPGTVGVRDTKARAAGTLVFPEAAWRLLTEGDLRFTTR